MLVALIRAQEALAKWVAFQVANGEDLPPGRGRGFTIFGGGVSKSDEHVYWSKMDIRRITGLSRSTIDRRIKDGTLEPKKFGRRSLFIPWQVRMAIGCKRIR